MDRKPRSQRIAATGETVNITPPTRANGPAETAAPRPSQAAAQPKAQVKVAAARPPARKTTGRTVRRNNQIRDIALMLGAVVIVVGGLFLVSSGFGSSGTPTDTGTSSSGSSSGAQTALAIGVDAPNFTLPDSNGNNVSLSDYKGKTVVLEFFAPWCPHCQDDAPLFENYYQQWKDKGVQFLAVSGTPYGRNYESGDTSPITAADVSWFQNNFNISFPVLFDKDVAQAKAYGISYFPFVYIINPNGKISAQPDNPTDAATMNTLIQAAIDEGAK